MQVNRRQFLGSSAAALTLAAVFGGKAFAQGVETLKIAMAARGLRTIDPHKSIQGADAWAIVSVYDNLVDLPLGHFPANLDDLRPRLATRWSASEDARTWTFQLREGVKFHKGYGEMTSEDVKYTFDRATDAKRIGGVRPKFANVAGVSTDGPHTVVFTLHKPDPLFPLGSLTDIDGSVMCRKAVEEKGDEAIAADPIGTGVYVLETVNADPSQGVTLAANTEYWDTPAATPKLQILYIADTTARTFAILSGDVHMIEGVRGPGWVDSIKQRDDTLQFDIASPGSLFSIHLNVTVAPFDDVKVRQAIFYALDRDEIATAIAPISQRAYGLNPPSFPGSFTAETIPPEVAYKYDPEKAKALLAEAGHAGGLSFRAMTSQREDYSAIMLMMQDQLRRVGIDMQLDIKDHTAFHADQQLGKNTISQHSQVLPPVPTQVISTYLAKEVEVRSDGKGGYNFSHYGAAIPGIDDMLAAALDEPDLERRYQLVRDIEVKVLEDAVMLLVSTNGFFMVRSPKVKLGFDVVSGYVDWPLSQAKITG